MPDAPTWPEAGSGLLSALRTYELDGEESGLRATVGFVRPRVMIDATALVRDGKRIHYGLLNWLGDEKDLRERAYVRYCGVSLATRDLAAVSAAFRRDVAGDEDARFDTGPGTVNGEPAMIYHAYQPGAASKNRVLIRREPRAEEFGGDAVWIETVSALEGDG